MNLNAQVTPLLSTTWNQTCNYNALMPTVSTGGACGRAFTGCNATAMAQICKYYAYPTTGFGTHCNSGFPGDCVDYTLANYNYVAMPNNVTSANADVATLMYDLGVAVDMAWSGTNSTSFFSSTVLKKYFGYSPKMYGTATFLFNTTGDLIDAIEAELDAGRPVFAKGGGHFYLLDGYNASDQFHMNFGWGGTYDGYYAIDAVVNPAGTFTPTNFIFQIEPLNGTVEVGQDTIFIDASPAFVVGIEFTSSLTWTMGSNESWLTPALTSGAPGYFTSAEGATFAALVNNGPQRIGYINIANSGGADTIVVVQEGSPLGATPDPVNFVNSGGNQTVDITFYSWANWTATTAEPWLTLSSASGTGNGSFDITCSSNTSGPARSGFVIISGGVFVDTILVTQEGGSASLNIESQKTLLYPNPVTDVLYIDGLLQEKPSVYNLLGEEISPNISSDEKDKLTLDLSDFASGVYLLQLGDYTYRIRKE